MNVECFIDTNVLVYSVSDAPHEADKKFKAREIIANTHFGTSGQVLQEFFVTVTRKAKRTLSVDRALAIIAELEEMPCISVGAALVRRAAKCAERFQISYWDGAIISAAEELGAPILYSEDLNHNQLYGSVRALNPFRLTQ